MSELILLVDRGAGQPPRYVGTARREPKAAHTEPIGPAFVRKLDIAATRVVDRWWLVEADNAEIARGIVHAFTTHGLLERGAQITTRWRGHNVTGRVIAHH